MNEGKTLKPANCRTWDMGKPLVYEGVNVVLVSRTVKSHNILACLEPG